MFDLYIDENYIGSDYYDDDSGELQCDMCKDWYKEDGILRINNDLYCEKCIRAQAELPVMSLVYFFNHKEDGDKITRMNGDCPGISRVNGSMTLYEWCLADFDGWVDFLRDERSGKYDKNKLYRAERMVTA